MGIWVLVPAYALVLFACPTVSLLSLAAMAAVVAGHAASKAAALLRLGIAFAGLNIMHAVLVRTIDELPFATAFVSNPSIIRFISSEWIVTAMGAIVLLISAMIGFSHSSRGDADKVTKDDVSAG